ncbi:phosphoribosylglycinamide formyltransferase [Adhaeribacter radiodurans]|uniref:Phosphoribosylglycinamide formyltransferase n=1 Tax=Adhaeribacter radiodurans TaxID=2745197 RepID=A0A7L7L2D5_9BACT|nr:phosphoribosylglycinamide formyltransferase [Adhaeribacter radiodurans]QMU26956.1 phosphoribosylglycinamide formyltransferase [Adhaeribacter radiodurans]
MADIKKHIVLFASGSGSNAQQIMAYFKDHPQIKVVALFSNKPDAYALKRAEAFEISSFSFTREEYKNGVLLRQVESFKPDLLVLAGFLWLIPLDFLQAFPNKIINIHPALLPKYGGKGMHGLHVHQAVLEAGEKESGITIHYVNEHYDQGGSIYQHTCPVDPNDTPEQLAARVLELEHTYLPRIIEQLLLSSP